MSNRVWASTAALLVSVTAVLAGCGQDDSSSANKDKERPASNNRADDAQRITDPIVATHRGGLTVIDGKKFEVVENIALDGFIRINPAGDDRHVLASTTEGFEVLDAVGGEMTGDTFEAEAAGHVVRHGGITTLFADGTGKVTRFDPDELGDGLPPTRTDQTDSPHHGVAVELPDGTLVRSEGNDHETTTAVALDEDGNEVARNENCPGLHGEATAADDTVLIGCENGALIYADGKFQKIDSPTKYGRIGNQAGSHQSPIVLGDYKQDPDAELERPRQVSLIDTENRRIRLVDLPATYSFRSLARGPDGEALVLGSDGKIHVIDPESGEIARAIEVLDEKWREPVNWQRPRPTLFARDNVAYVSDPENNELHAVDLASGKVDDTIALEDTPNELSGVVPDDSR